ncbi:substrate-binding periplasmic protein [Pseudomonas sp. NPDC089734]|uniref:substrate-binding periplasmic protein n=1 Tax=Pseudomonas sp. NPDC089734 TaxID=3364469 RepID=UPI0038258D54
MLIASLLLSWQVQAAQTVRVAAVHFPPYMIRPEKGNDTGLLPRLIEALNASQRDYEFVVVPTSVQRRFRDFAQGRFDVAIFENPDWGWGNVAYDKVDMGLEDAEVFVARRLEGRGQGYFNDLSDKRLALFSGYHYGFANFNADPKYLNEHFNATLTYSHDSNLLMVIRGRVDIAPVTRSYLVDFMAHNPSEAEQFLVSEKVDQLYRQYALLRPGGSIGARQFDRLLQQLRDNGQFAKIFEPLHIAVLPVPPYASAPAEKAGNKKGVK